MPEVQAIEVGLSAKVKQEADLEVRRLQVAVNLCLRALVKFESGFAFYNQLFIDEHVQPKLPKIVTLVKHRDVNLAAYLMPSCSELDFQSLHVVVL